MTDATTTLAHQLIQAQRTLVLATADPEPWSAPLYYLFRDRRFYFFSSPTSRHVVDALAAGRCAAALFRDSADWREIEGLQMDGAVEPVPMGTHAVGVFADYVRKFPTVKSLIADAPLDLARFTERFRTRLYAFVPRHVYYLNNLSGLGNRQKIELRS